MAGPRRYQLLCPIARALDRVGDRWTLLILRDLHAGPARFSDLKTGLDGIATNLLTGRLQQLMDDGLIQRRQADYGVTLYELTALGGRSRDLLFELARFGGRFPPDKDHKRPGNLRTVAVTLQVACQRVVTPDIDLIAEIIIDGERFTLNAANGSVDVRYAAAEAPDVTFTTEYEPMMTAGDGAVAMAEFMANHTAIVVHKAGKDRELQALLGAAMTLLVDGA